MGPRRVLGFTEAVVTKFELRIEKKPNGECWVLVKTIEWHTRVNTVSLETFRRREGAWNWKAYEASRGQSNADWYYRGRFTTYWAHRTHEQEHMRQFEEAAKVALPRC